MIYPSRASIAVTHLPTGITEHTNGYRSQHTNRAACYARLKSKLLLGATHPLPIRATYDLPDDKPVGAFADYGGGHTDHCDLTQFRDEPFAAVSDVTV